LPWPTKALKHYSAYTDEYGATSESARLGTRETQWVVAPGPNGVTVVLLF
jgi:hypothetical protein